MLSCFCPCNTCDLFTRHVSEKALSYVRRASAKSSLKDLLVVRDQLLHHDGIHRNRRVDVLEPDLIFDPRLVFDNRLELPNTAHIFVVLIRRGRCLETLAKKQCGATEGFLCKIVGERSRRGRRRREEGALGARWHLRGRRRLWTVRRSLIRTRVLLSKLIMATPYQTQLESVEQYTITGRYTHYWCTKRITSIRSL